VKTILDLGNNETYRIINSVRHKLNMSTLTLEKMDVLRYTISIQCLENIQKSKGTDITLINKNKDDKIITII
jgi:hypothetical protein